MLRRACSLLAPGCTGASTIAAAAAAPPTARRQGHFPPRNVPWEDARSTLTSMRPVEYSSLSNGFRVAVEHIPQMEFGTIGIWIDAGSRFETRANNGVAHFLEHMNFKGTERFSKSAIDTFFERRGAHFNAYTSRDRTAYYVKSLNKDADEVMDLLSDVLQNGVYSPRYIELERPTILSEMREVEELVEEVTLDGLHIAAYDGSVGGLSLTILGPTDNIARYINRNMITDYVQTHYTGPRMCMVSSGGLSHREVHALAEKYFSKLPAHSNRPILESSYVGGTYSLWNPAMMAAHTHIAFPCCGAAHRDAITLQLLQNLYGIYRAEMATQFSMQGANVTRPPIPGLEFIKFFYVPYEETGLMGFQIIGVPQPESKTVVADTMHHILGSLQRLMDKPPTAAQLEGAKATYKAAQLFPIDSTTNSAEDLGRQMVHFGRRIPVQELFSIVDSITPNEFSDVLARYFDWTAVRPTISAAGPPEALPQFEALVNAVPWSC